MKNQSTTELTFELQRVKVKFNDGSERTYEAIEKTYLGPDGIALCLTNIEGNEFVINWTTVKSYEVERYEETRKIRRSNDVTITYEDPNIECKVEGDELVLRMNRRTDK